MGRKSIEQEQRDEDHDEDRADVAAVVNVVLSEDIQSEADARLIEMVGADDIASVSSRVTYSLIDPKKP